MPIIVLLIVTLFAVTFPQVVQAKSCDGLTGTHRNAGNGCMYSCNEDTGQWGSPSSCDNLGNGQFQGDVQKAIEQYTPEQINQAVQTAQAQAEEQLAKQSAEDTARLQQERALQVAAAEQAQKETAAANAAAMYQAAGGNPADIVEINRRAAAAEAQVAAAVPAAAREAWHTNQVANLYFQEEADILAACSRQSGWDCSSAASAQKSILNALPPDVQKEVLDIDAKNKDLQNRAEIAVSGSNAEVAAACKNKAGCNPQTNTKDQRLALIAELTGPDRETVTTAILNNITVRQASAKVVSQCRKLDPQNPACANPQTAVDIIAQKEAELVNQYANYQYQRPVSPPRDCPHCTPEYMESRDLSKIMSQLSSPVNQSLAVIARAVNLRDLADLSPSQRQAAEQLLAEQARQAQALDRYARTSHVNPDSREIALARDLAPPLDIRKPPANSTPEQTALAILADNLYSSNFAKADEYATQYQQSLANKREHQITQAALELATSPTNISPDERQENRDAILKNLSDNQKEAAKSQATDIQQFIDCRGDKCTNLFSQLQTFLPKDVLTEINRVRVGQITFEQSQAQALNRQIAQAQVQAKPVTSTQQGSLPDESGEYREVTVATTKQCQGDTLTTTIAYSGEYGTTSSKSQVCPFGCSAGQCSLLSNNFNANPAHQARYDTSVAAEIALGKTADEAYRAVGASNYQPIAAANFQATPELFGQLVQSKGERQAREELAAAAALAAVVPQANLDASEWLAYGRIRDTAANLGALTPQVQADILAGNIKPSDIENLIAEQTQSPLGRLAVGLNNWTQGSYKRNLDTQLEAEQKILAGDRSLRNYFDLGRGAVAAGAPAAAAVVAVVAAPLAIPILAAVPAASLLPVALQMTSSAFGIYASTQSWGQTAEVCDLRFQTRSEAVKCGIAAGNALYMTLSTGLGVINGAAPVAEAVAANKLAAVGANAATVIDDAAAALSAITKAKNITPPGWIQWADAGNSVLATGVFGTQAVINCGQVIAGSENADASSCFVHAGMAIASAGRLASLGMFATGGNQLGAVTGKLAGTVGEGADVLDGLSSCRFGFGQCVEGLIDAFADPKGIGQSPFASFTITESATSKYQDALSAYQSDPTAQNATDLRAAVLAAAAQQAQINQALGYQIDSPATAAEQEFVAARQNYQSTSDPIALLNAKMHLDSERFFTSADPRTGLQKLGRPDPAMAALQAAQTHFADIAQSSSPSDPAYQTAFLQVQMALETANLAYHPQLKDQIQASRQGRIDQLQSQLTDLETEAEAYTLAAEQLTDEDDLAQYQAKIGELNEKAAYLGNLAQNLPPPPAPISLDTSIASLRADPTPNLFQRAKSWLTNSLSRKPSTPGVESLSGFGQVLEPGAPVPAPARVPAAERGPPARPALATREFVTTAIRPTEETIAPLPIEQVSKISIDPADLTETIGKPSSSATVYRYSLEIEGAEVPAAVKVYRFADGDYPERFAREVEKAQLVDRLGIGPRFYGVADLGDGRLAFIMDEIPGMSIKGAEKELGGVITGQTFRDVREIEARLVRNGYGLAGDFEIMVTPSGRAVVVDPTAIIPLTFSGGVARTAEVANDTIRILQEIRVEQRGLLGRLANLFDSFTGATKGLEVVQPRLAEVSVPRVEAPVPAAEAAPKGGVVERIVERVEKLVQRSKPTGVYFTPDNSVAFFIDATSGKAALSWTGGGLPIGEVRYGNRAVDFSVISQPAFLLEGNALQIGEEVYRVIVEGSVIKLEHQTDPGRSFTLPGFQAGQLVRQNETSPRNNPVLPRAAEVPQQVAGWLEIRNEEDQERYYVKLDFGATDRSVKLTYAGGSVSVLKEGARNIEDLNRLILEKVPPGATDLRVGVYGRGGELVGGEIKGIEAAAQIRAVAAVPRPKGNWLAQLKHEWEIRRNLVVRRVGGGVAAPVAAPDLAAVVGFEATDEVPQRLAKLGQFLDGLSAETAAATNVPLLDRWSYQSIPKEGSLDDDIGGAPLSGWGKFASNEVWQINTAGGRQVYLIVTGKTDSADPSHWQITALDKDEVVVGQGQTIEGVARLRVVSEADRSYGQLTTLDQMEVRSVPNHLMRLALGLAPKPVQFPDMAPYYYPPFSAEEIKAIQSTPPTFLHSGLSPRAVANSLRFVADNLKDTGFLILKPVEAVLEGSANSLDILTTISESPLRTSRDVLKISQHPDLRLGDKKDAILFALTAGNAGYDLETLTLFNQAKALVAQTLKTTPEELPIRKSDLPAILQQANRIISFYSGRRGEILGTDPDIRAFDAYQRLAGKSPFSGSRKEALASLIRYEADQHFARSLTIKLSERDPKDPYKRVEKTVSAENMLKRGRTSFTQAVQQAAQEHNEQFGTSIEVRVFDPVTVLPTQKEEASLKPLQEGASAFFDRDTGVEYVPRRTTGYFETRTHEWVHSLRSMMLDENAWDSKLQLKMRIAEPNILKFPEPYEGASRHFYTGILSAIEEGFTEHATRRILIELGIPGYRPGWVTSGGSYGKALSIVDSIVKDLQNQGVDPGTLERVVTLAEGGNHEPLVQLLGGWKAFAQRFEEFRGTQPITHPVYELRSIPSTPTLLYSGFDPIREVINLAGKISPSFSRAAENILSGNWRQITTDIHSPAVSEKDGSSENTSNLVRQIAKNVSDHFTERGQPCTFGGRQGLCDAGTELVRYLGIRTGLTAKVYSDERVNPLRGIEYSQGHGFTILEDRHGNGFIVDVTLWQFLDNNGRIPDGIEEGSGDQTLLSPVVNTDNPVIRQILDDGFVPLTEETLTTYLNALAFAPKYGEAQGVKPATLQLLDTARQFPFNSGGLLSGINQRLMNSALSRNLNLKPDLSYFITTAFITYDDVKSALQAMPARVAHIFNRKEITTDEGNTYTYELRKGKWVLISMFQLPPESRDYLTNPQNTEYLLGQFGAMLQTRDVSDVNSVVQALRNNLASQGNTVEVWQRHISPHTTLANFIALTQGGVPVPLQPGQQSQIPQIISRVHIEVQSELAQLKTKQEIIDYIIRDLESMEVEIRDGTPRVATKGYDVMKDVGSMSENYIQFNRNRPMLAAHEWEHVRQVKAFLEAGIPTGLIENKLYVNQAEAAAAATGTRLATSSKAFDAVGAFTQPIAFTVAKIGLIGPLNTFSRVVTYPINVVNRWWTTTPGVESPTQTQDYLTDSQNTDYLLGQFRAILQTKGVSDVESVVQALRSDLATQGNTGETWQKHVSPYTTLANFIALTQGGVPVPLQPVFDEEAREALVTRAVKLRDDLNRIGEKGDEEIGPYVNRLRNPDLDPLVVGLELAQHIKIFAPKTSTFIEELVAASRKTSSQPVPVEASSPKQSWQVPNSGPITDIKLVIEFLKAMPHVDLELFAGLGHTHSLGLRQVPLHQILHAPSVTDWSRVKRSGTGTSGFSVTGRYSDAKLLQMIQEIRDGQFDLANPKGKNPIKLIHLGNGIYVATEGTTRIIAALAAGNITTIPAIVAEVDSDYLSHPWDLTTNPRDAQDVYEQARDAIENPPTAPTLLYSGFDPIRGVISLAGKINPSFARAADNILSGNWGRIASDIGTSITNFADFLVPGSRDLQGQALKEGQTTVFKSRVPSPKGLVRVGEGWGKMVAKIGYNQKRLADWGRAAVDRLRLTLVNPYWDRQAHPPTWQADRDVWFYRMALFSGGGEAEFFEAGKVVVDLGGGVGRGALGFSRAYPDTTIMAVDKNYWFSKAVDLARSGLQLIKGDWEKVPVPDQSADSIMSVSAAFTHGNIPGVVKEVTRIAKQGAVLRVAEVVNLAETVAELEKRGWRVVKADKFWLVAEKESIQENLQLGKVEVVSGELEQSARKEIVAGLPTKDGRREIKLIVEGNSQEEILAGIARQLDEAGVISGTEFTLAIPIVAADVAPTTVELGLRYTRQSDSLQGLALKAPQETASLAERLIVRAVAAGEQAWARIKKPGGGGDDGQLRLNKTFRRILAFVTLGLLASGDTQAGPTPTPLPPLDIVKEKGLELFKSDLHRVITLERKYNIQIYSSNNTPTPQLEISQQEISAIDTLMSLLPPEFLRQTYTATPNYSPTQYPYQIILHASMKQDCGDSNGPGTTSLHPQGCAFSEGKIYIVTLTCAVGSTEPLPCEHFMKVIAHEIMHYQTGFYQFKTINSSAYCSPESPRFAQCSTMEAFEAAAAQDGIRYTPNWQTGTQDIYLSPQIQNNLADSDSWISNTPNLEAVAFFGIDYIFNSTYIQQKYPHIYAFYRDDIFRREYYRVCSPLDINPSSCTIQFTELP